MEVNIFFVVWLMINGYNAATPAGGGRNRKLWEGGDGGGGGHSYAGHALAVTVMV